MKNLFLFMICVLLLACQFNSTTNDKSIVEGEIGLKMDSLLTPYVDELRALTDNSAGLAIAITENDIVVYAKTFGYAQLDEKKNIDLHTGFHIASLSKPFCAVAIARLIQDDKVALDDLIVKYISEFEMLGEGYDEITIEHILSHTSGIPRNIAIDDWLRPSFGPNALEENLEIIKKLELDFTPGTKFSYSNSAYDILGIVISRISEMPFHEYIEKKIFIPLGMENSFFKKSNNKSLENVAAAHSYGLGTQPWSPYPYNERLFPSSGVIASLNDMCKWAQFYAGKGSLDGKQILDEKHFEMVTSPKFKTPWGDEIGLSWFLQSYLDKPIIMHTGADTGFESIMYFYPEDNISIIVLANRDFSRTGRIINAASEILFNEQAKTYNVSSKYKFTKAYKDKGIVYAKRVWEELKKDTIYMHQTDNDDILTTGAILENGEHWTEAQEILNFYISQNDQSTYAWRLIGNTYLSLGDTVRAKECYQKTLTINPSYDKGRKALEALEKVN